MSLQTLIKNVQELAKEEGEESEAKLREVIEILEGATFATASSWGYLCRRKQLARLLEDDFLGVQILASG